MLLASKGTLAFEYSAVITVIYYTAASGADRKSLLGAPVPYCKYTILK